MCAADPVHHTRDRNRRERDNQWGYISSGSRWALLNTSFPCICSSISHRLLIDLESEAAPSELHKPMSTTEAAATIQQLQQQNTDRESSRLLPRASPSPVSAAQFEADLLSWSSTQNVANTAPRGVYRWVDDRRLACVRASARNTLVEEAVLARRTGSCLQ